jgi:hypothetical protein
MGKFKNKDKQFNITLFFSVVILLITFLFVCNQYSKNESISVSFSGIENTNNQEVTINSGKLIDCTYNDDKNISLNNGDKLTLTCTNKIFPLIKLDQSILVEGLMETETTSKDQLITYVMNSVATTIPNIDASTLTQILYHSDPVDGMKLIPLFIVDDQTFNYYFIEKAYIENDEFVTYHEGKIREGMSIFSTATGANLKDYDEFIQLYRDLGYNLLMDQG